MPSRDSKRNQQGNYNNYGNSSNGRGGGGGGGGPPRNHVIPTEAPFTAYIGNAPESMVQGDFEKLLFVGLKIKQVRLVRDRQTDRFRGFGYVDFDDADSLRRAIELDGTCVNDRPIRIDVAARPLGAGKPEGFRNKPDFESRDGRRQPSGNSNNRSNDGFRQSGRTGNNYNQQQTSENVADGYNEEYYTERNRRSSGSGKINERRHSQSQQHKTPPRKVSNNDDVFLGPDTPTSNEDGVDHTNNDQGSTAIVRQQSRNWADCPIDESVVEPSSPPPSANNTLSGDDFQVVRNKNPKSRNNQQPSSRPAGNQSARGRNNRGGPAHMSGGGGGRGYYEQIQPQYSNQSQQFYHQQQQAPPPLHMGLSYHMNTNNNNSNRPPGGSRQRLNSNRSNTSRTYNDNNERSKTGTNDISNEIINDSSVPAENRPRLQLLPRSQKLSSSTDDNQTPEPTAARNAGIFGCGKPRDERDPKLVEFNKHIEEVVEKEQHVPQAKSTTSDGSTDGVTKPVRILTAATESLVGH